MLEDGPRGVSDVARQKQRAPSSCFLHVAQSGASIRTRCAQTPGAATCPSAFPGVLPLLRCLLGASCILALIHSADVCQALCYHSSISESHHPQGAYNPQEQCGRVVATAEEGGGSPDVVHGISLANQLAKASWRRWNRIGLGVTTHSRHQIP